ncbi:hypothetical protein [Pantoea sp. 1.19]|uniref:hypothetical protein n=1 Tax=Pantoea sp. 1.19 TaxID=1925589 RepID=UPI001F0A66E5|nr:hypothetical protein [Pantoea sp. 1.19]
MTLLHLSVVQRLPQTWRVSADRPGFPVLALASASGDDYIGLQLLGLEGALAWEVMQGLQQTLSEIQIACFVAEWLGQPCLFVHRSDESAANCRLKNLGVAIAESICGGRDEALNGSSAAGGCKPAAER